MRKYKKHEKGICQKCGEVNDRVPQRWCCKCHALYVRKWRKNYKLNLQQKKKDACRSYASVYLKRGKIIKQPCQKCGNEKSEMHHNDYNEPLKIIWVCRRCHLGLHNEVQ